MHDGEDARLHPFDAPVASTAHNDAHARRLRFAACLLRFFVLGGLGALCFAWWEGDGEPINHDKTAAGRRDKVGFGCAQLARGEMQGRAREPRAGDRLRDSPKVIQKEERRMPRGCLALVSDQRRLDCSGRNRRIGGEKRAELVGIDVDKVARAEFAHVQGGRAGLLVEVEVLLRGLEQDMRLARLKAHLGVKREATQLHQEATPHIRVVLQHRDRLGVGPDRCARVLHDGILRDAVDSAQRCRFRWDARDRDGKCRQQLFGIFR